MTSPASRDDVLVQPLLVSFTPEARAIDLVEHVALASARMISRTMLFDQASSEYQATSAWLEASMTKSVRRISRTKMTKLHEGIAPDHPSWMFSVGATPAYDPENHGPVVVAAAGQVQTYGELSPVAKRGQVSFTGPVPMVGERSSCATGRAELIVHLDGELGMSVGKMAAQAAHGLTHLAATTNFDHDSVEFVVEDTATMRELTKSSLVVIRDNGLTEIPDGSLTAVVTHA